MKKYHPYLLIGLFTTMGAYTQNVGFDSNTGRPLQVQKNNKASSSLQHKVFENFKDDINLAESNPSVYKSASEIKIIKETELHITFISEETAGNNSLAYFTYKTGTDPNTATKTDIKIIFPKVNNSVLEYGDMVAIGSFKAGTSIGFALLKNGWTGKSVDFAASKIYTTDKPKAVAAAYDSETALIVLGFEEKPQSAILDLNDVLIGIHASEMSALKTQSLAILSTADIPDQQSADNKTNTSSVSSTPTVPIPVSEPSSYYSCFDDGMPETNYNSSLKLIRNTSDDANKIRLIKNSVEGFKITPEQAKTYCIQLSNYSHRFDMAKYLFDYECEKDKASLLSEAIKNSTYEKQYLNFVSQRLKEEKLKNQQAQAPTTQQPTPQNQTVIIVDPNSGYGNGYPNRYQRGIPFSAQELNQLLIQMSNATFDSHMEDLVTVAVTGRVLTTYQTRQILNKFSFDSYRLNTAKYLYDYTYDKHIYYTLNSTFTFGRYQKEFLDFVRSRGGRVY